jgi:hypothetical protein
METVKMGQKFSSVLLEDKIYLGKGSSNHAENPPRHSSLAAAL